MTKQFTDFNLKPAIMDALAEINFNTPTAVQERLIPTVISGRSVVGQSQTGSGKTHTFLLPIFQNLDVNFNQVQAVITTPSRELAQQIYNAAKQIAKHFDAEIRIANYVGGTDKERQLKQLATAQPHIVIGTPGRIADLLKAQALYVHFSKTLVVDEADMTLDLGFLPEVDAVAGAMPEDLQMLVFSATIPQKLQPFLRKYLSNPVVEEIPVTTVISPTIENWLISTKSASKNEVILKLLTLGQPYLALIFTNTKERADELSHFLRGQNLKVATVHGGIAPRERKRVMKQVQNLDFQYVVATDLAARGIDIEGVSHVINDDIPADLDFFIHRVGRTGRNGMSGIAITLYTPDNDDQVAELENLGVKFQPKAIKGDQIVDTFDRKRREKRNKTQKKLDPTMIGLIKKKKKKIKPGYKHQINQAIKRKAQMDRRIEQRMEQRATRKANKVAADKARGK